MLLAVDTGNTHTVLGLFDGERLAADWRIATREGETADELGALFRALFAGEGLEPSSVDGVIVSSVVPDWNGILAATARRAFGHDALFVAPGVKTGLPILYENPHEVGADRIVNAVAAVHCYGAPVIVLDFGTATTFDAVSAKGEYLGGAIAPGIQIAAEALYLKTARLPRIEIKKPKRAIGRTTVSSMQAGLYFGYIGLVTNTIEEIRKELGKNARVVATGGFGSQIAAELPAIEAYEPDLVLEGLRIIHERNRDAKP